MGGSSAAAARPRTWSQPTWQQSPAPYNPAYCAMDDDYYLSFPPPWDKVPARAADARPGEILKVYSPHSMPKFGGEAADYITWRTSFLPCIHLAPTDLGLKIMMARATLLPNTKKMKELLANFLCTPDGYRNMIILLERAFGGEDNLLVVRQEAVLQLPILREGDLETLDTLYMRLGTFLLEWRAQGGNSHDETASKSFFNIVAGRIDERYARQYVNWLRLNNLAKGLHTLHQWLEEQLEDHRAVDTFSRGRKGTGAGVGAGNSWQSRGGRQPPAGQQDRNFNKPRAFLHAGEGDWEDVEENFDGDADEAVLVGVEEKSQGDRCPLCPLTHPLGRCGEFRKLPAQEKRAFLVQHRRCFLCFQKNHNVRNCSMKSGCRQCGDKHHTWLHGTKYVANPQALLLYRKI